MWSKLMPSFFLYCDSVHLWRHFFRKKFFDKKEPFSLFVTIVHLLHNYKLLFSSTTSIEPVSHRVLTRKVSQKRILIGQSLTKRVPHLERENTHLKCKSLYSCVYLSLGYFYLRIFSASKSRERAREKKKRKGKKRRRRERARREEEEKGQEEKKKRIRQRKLLHHPSNILNLESLYRHNHLTVIGSTSVSITM